jgi:hypothetical protein
MVRAVLKQMPDDCSLEDVQYQLYLRQKLEKSRVAAAEGRLAANLRCRRLAGGDEPAWKAFPRAGVSYEVESERVIEDRREDALRGLPADAIREKVTVK